MVLVKGIDGLFRRFLSVFSARIITTIIAIVSTPIIVRLLGPGGYGDYAVFLSVFTLYMIPVSSGITEGVQKFVAEKRDDEHWQEAVIRFYGLLAVVIGIVGVLVLVAVTAVGIPRWMFGERFTLYFSLLAVFVLVAQFRAFLYHVVLGFGLEPVSESLNVLRKMGTVVLGIVLVFVGFGVSGMILGHIAANVLVTLIAAYVILGQISVSGVRSSLSESFPRNELLSFNVLNIVLVLLLMSLYHVDIIMLRVVVGDETTGFYKAALQLAEYLWIVPIALQLLLLHSTSTLWSENRTDEITRLASRIMRYTVLVVSLMAIGVAVLADRFVPLYYGDPFTVSVLPLLLLLPGTVGFALARPLQAISQGSGRVRTLIAATGVAATMNLLLNAALIPTYGMVGAAVATSVSYGSMFGLFVWAARRIGYDPLDDFRGLRVVATVALAAPLLYVLEQSITSDLVAFLVVPPAGVAIFGLLAFSTGAIDRAEVDQYAHVPRINAD